MNPIDATIAKYNEYGWTVIRAPVGGINDIIAAKGPRLHFIQVTTKESEEEARYHGQAKNDFIQNAFSNQALPIRARVGRCVTFEDVNLGSRVIIGAKKGGAGPSTTSKK
jgi:hypothetical protein